MGTKAFMRALGSSTIGLVLLLGACARGAEHPTLEDQADAGWSRLSVKAKCDPPNGWHLVSRFRLARKVDYIADCDNLGTVISEKGEPCAADSDRADCEAALATPGFGRHLVTREGSQVRLWTSSVVTLLGNIDTPEEAIWLVLQQDIDVDCDTRVFDTHGGGFSVDGNRAPSDCPDQRDFFEVNVSVDGLVSDGQQLNAPGATGTICGRSI